MDISTITDVTKLKAMAYDELARLEQAQTNIRNLNVRIAEVENKPTLDYPAQDEAVVTDTETPEDA